MFLIWVLNKLCPPWWINLQPFVLAALNVLKVDVTSPRTCGGHFEAVQRTRLTRPSRQHLFSVQILLEFRLT